MKRLFTTLLITAVTAGAMAQEGDAATHKNAVETNRMRDNWFLQLGVGPTIYLGGLNDGSMGKRLAPVLDLSFGRWLTPAVGWRAQLNIAPNMKEYSENYTGKFNQWAKDGDGLYLHKFHHVNAHADVMWDLMTSFSGYNPSRCYSLIPYVGLGLGLNAYSGASSMDTEWTGNVGLINKFRVNDKMDVNLEIRSAIANGRFDDAVRYNHFDVPVAITAGVTFRIGKVKDFKRVNRNEVSMASTDVNGYQDRITSLEKEKSDLTNQSQQLAKELSDLRNADCGQTTNQAQSTSAVAPKVVMKATPVVLFFAIGKAQLDSKELTNLEFYVRNAIQLDTEKVFTLIGSADRDTGSKEQNMRLSEQRMQLVYDLLVNKYKIPESRLIKKFIGDTNNRFDEPKLNRAVIIE